MATFHDEVNKLDTVIVSTSGALLREDNDLKMETSAELFPDDGTPIAAERGGELEEFSDFVQFRIDGVPYVFKDVPVIAWFAPYVRDVAERAVVSGYRDANGVPLGIFGPERNVTLEELAKMAVQASKTDLSACPEVPLNPKAKGQWSAPYVSCAEQQAFAVYADGAVDLKRNATRSEVVITVLQAFGRSVNDQTVTSFKDVNSSTPFGTAIGQAVADGIVSGYTDQAGNPTGLFGPMNPVNRAEIAKIISRSISIYAN